MSLNTGRDFLALFYSVVYFGDGRVVVRITKGRHQALSWWFPEQRTGPVHLVSRARELMQSQETGILFQFILAWPLSYIFWYERKMVQMRGGSRGSFLLQEHIPQRCLRTSQFQPLPYNTHKSLGRGGRLCRSPSIKVFNDPTVLFSFFLLTLHQFLISPSTTNARISLCPSGLQSF